MFSDAQRLLVLSDVHLGHDSEPIARDLKRLLDSAGNAEVVLAGDVFDLSIDPPRRDPADSIVRLLREHRALHAALRSHLSRGGRVTLIAGNHDAAVADARVRSALLSSLELGPDAPLRTEPWFIRRGSVHIEHGHLYDPDNAPAHPLALWSHSTEPLGIALTRRFLAPSGALAFAHAHETTPLGGLLRAFELFGARAPLIVAQYFATAIQICIEAGRQTGVALERELGHGMLEEFAARTGLTADLLAELAESRPDPTHHRFSDTFMRLYFDRVIACVTLAASASTLLVRRSLPGLLISAASGLYLSHSVRKNKSRYSGQIEQRLRDAAHLISERTAAELVIFGHTHREDEAPRYLNSGSFAYTRTGGGRPYILIEPGHAAERRHLAPV